METVLSSGFYRSVSAFFIFIFFGSHRSLTRVAVKPEMRKEIEENQKVS